MGLVVHCSFFSPHAITLTEWRLCTPVSPDHMNRNGIVHLECYGTKVFSGLRLLSALIFILGAFVLLGFCHWGLSLPPLISLITRTEWGLPTPVSCDNMNRKGTVQLEH